MLAGLVAWSLLTWMGYALVNPILAWVAANAGLLVDSGKDLATATGAGKEVGSVVDNLNVSGFLGQAIALLRAVLKPALIVLWAIGVLVLIAAPVIVPRIGRMLGERRHRSRPASKAGRTEDRYRPSLTIIVGISFTGGVLEWSQIAQCHVGDCAQDDRDIVKAVAHGSPERTCGP